MKFDEIVKAILEDYNYDFTSGKYKTGTAYAGGPNTPLNVAMPFPGIGGANEPLGRGLFPQKKDYKTQEDEEKQKKNRKKKKNKK
jgi:hypothetical protein